MIADRPLTNVIRNDYAWVKVYPFGYAICPTAAILSGCNQAETVIVGEVPASVYRTPRYRSLIANVRGGMGIMKV